MRSKLISLFILFFSYNAQAGYSCKYAEQLGNPKVRENAAFWEEFSRISKRGDDRELATLLKKFEVNVEGEAKAPSVSQAAVATSARTAAPYRLTSTAAKELKNLQPQLRMKLDKFLNLASHSNQREFYSALRQEQGSWQLEKLAGNKAYSVRLNDGYRVVFREVDDSIEIMNFSKTATHGGH